MSGPADGDDEVRASPRNEQAPEPSPLAEAFLAMHEMFLSMVAAGFSEYQACVMLGSWMAASGQAGSGSNG